MAGAVIITGSSRGIGAATATLIASRGHPVCINHRDSAADADAIAHTIEAAGGRTIVVQGDMGNDDDVVRLFETCDRELGTLGGLVANAGIVGPVSRVDALDRAALDHVLAVNVAGVFACAREAVRRLSTRHGGKGGAIVNVSSRAAALGGPGEWVHYAASKAAVDTLTLGLAKEVGGEGIRVNAVNPGLIDTEIHERAGVGDRIERLVGGVPMGRVGTADEVAEAIAWLMSDAASYITGVCVDISGGR
jgi:NAD(P)-dependent dehydrogenase (short-subunit alcohol dehydrogenase family)